MSNSAVLLNRLGLVVGCGRRRDNMHDKHFAYWSRRKWKQMVAPADHGLRADMGDPPNLNPCQRGQWN
ncbi:MAG: hypothetical protein U1F68_01930 [Gammaproteobacteria bacterium]